MRTLVLQRSRSTDQGTLGELFREDGSHVAWTLEPPWRNNTRSKSCIPPGVYRCIWRRSPKFGMVYEVTGVSGRSNILLHSGNVAGDTELGYFTHSLGCILLGSYVGIREGQLAVLVSKPAVSAFQREMAGEPFMLEVRSWASSTS